MESARLKKLSLERLIENNGQLFWEAVDGNDLEVIKLYHGPLLRLIERMGGMMVMPELLKRGLSDSISPSLIIDIVKKLYDFDFDVEFKPFLDASKQSDADWIGDCAFHMMERVVTNYQKKVGELLIFQYPQNIQTLLAPPAALAQLFVWYAAGRRAEMYPYNPEGIRLFYGRVVVRVKQLYSTQTNFQRAFEKKLIKMTLHALNSLKRLAGRERETIKTNMPNVFYTNLLGIKADVSAIPTPTPFEDIVGMASAKDFIRKNVVSQLIDELQMFSESATRSLLLYGLPGTGKSELVRAIPSIAPEVYFVGIPLSTILVSENPDRLLRDIFRAARNNRPSIVFFDEADGFLAPTAGESRYNPEILKRMRYLRNEFLYNMDERGRNIGVIVIAATNYIKDIEPAALRRFENRVFVDLPNKAERRLLLMNFLSNHQSTLSDSEIEDVVNRTAGYSGSDIITLVKQAKTIRVLNVLAEADSLRLEKTFSPRPDDIITKYIPVESISGVTLRDVFNDKVKNVSGKQVLIPPITAKQLNEALVSVRATVAPSVRQEYLDRLL